MRRETRTTVQIEANAIDLDMFRLSQRMEAFATLVRNNDISLDAGHLSGARYAVREHMHKNDREATNG